MNENQLPVEGEKLRETKDESLSDAPTCSACGYELDTYVNHMECYKCGKWYEKTPQNEES